ncbi:MAG: argininosuccinate synthase [Zetaproteobacteria bacterium]|nr:argininosuccinate synthase [Zetaproteobacteria bacterium]
MRERKTVVLAYSGGLDTSAILVWLNRVKQMDVIAYCCDVGNLPEQEQLRSRAMELGAKQFIFEDLKQVYLQRFVMPLLRAGAKYQSQYLLGTAIARPLMAERIAWFAKEYGADAIAHGATGKGNDQIRFERSWAYLCPDIELIAPWKEWSFGGRKDLVQYMEEQGFPVASTTRPRFSEDVNLFHRSCEGHELEDITSPYAAHEVLDWISTTMHEDQEVHRLEFVAGTLTKWNETVIDASNDVVMYDALNGRAAHFGLGCLDMVEDRVNGIKSRGIYETPAGVVLDYALQQLRQLCYSKDQGRIATQMAMEFAELIYAGEWHSMAAQGVRAYFEQVCQTLTGSVELQFNWKQMRVRGRESTHSLYRPAMMSFEEDPYGFHHASEGFSKTLRYRSWLEGQVSQQGTSAASKGEG